ncbi:MAG TPA: hypothetical protein VLA43_14895, partial [Longimicrobiales bacterium]|nr:hypothetical protein [Longimicrobiales bacterium]
MSEPRQDPLRGWWTRVSPGRGARPVDAALRALPGGPGADGETGAPVPGCPFCPGGEGQLETILESVERPDGGWAAR